VQDELHAARLVEEALEDERILRWDGAERGARVGEIVDRLFRRRGVGARFGLEPIGRRRGGREPGVDLGAEIAHLARELVAARGGLAEPERNVRRRAFRVGHADHAGAHLQHAPRRVAELKDIARVAFDREVFVQRPDEGVFRLQEHAVVGHFGDRAAGGERQHARAAPAAEAAANFVAMHERAAASAFRRKTFGDHLQR
jgi:hypothetical protein